MQLTKFLEYRKKSIEPKCLQLILDKNCDYASKEDCFSNLRPGGLFGIATRLVDKAMRISNLSRESLLGIEPKVSDESILDTIYDLRNWCDLFLGLHSETESAITEEAESLGRESSKSSEATSKRESIRADSERSAYPPRPLEEGPEIVTGVYDSSQI